MARRAPAWVLVVSAGALALSCSSGSGSPPGRWDEEMKSAREAELAGEPARAAESYRRALGAAARQPHHPGRVAAASWHLGDVCFRHDGLCHPGEARHWTQESFRVFGAIYGPEHPVVIPVLLRLSEIHALEGDAAGAEELLEQADRITARAFPESHFMRVRSEGHRPASDLDPQEVLRILAEVDILDG